MPFALLVISMGANLIGGGLIVAAPVAAKPVKVVPMPLAVQAADRAAIIRRASVRVLSGDGRERVDAPSAVSPVTSGPEAASTLDLALYVGRGSAGPRLELGALGGGRADAPGLLHVGFGLDF